MDKGKRIVLVLAVLAGLLGCRMTDDQKSAYEACQRHGNDSKPCAMANRMLASGATGIAKALEAEAAAREAAATQAEAAAAREAELAAAGKDACEALREKLAADHPSEACAAKLDEAVQSLKENPEIGGCAGALNEPEWAADEAANFLGDCDAS